MTDQTDQTDPVTPGFQTSEGKLAVVTTVLTILGAVVPPVWVALSNLATAYPQVRWLAGAVSVASMLLGVLNTLGYAQQRTALKTAALNPKDRELT